MEIVNYNNYQVLFEQGEKFGKMEMGKILGSGANASVRLGQ